MIYNFISTSVEQFKFRYQTTQCNVVSSVAIITVSSRYTPTLLSILTFI
jgi:hypothetical protein